MVTKAGDPAKPKPAARLLPGCDGRTHDVDSYAHVRLPDKVLCTLPGGSDERLRADAALAFVRLAAAYQAAWGEPICLTDGYRTLGEQQQLRRISPGSRLGPAAGGTAGASRWTCPAASSRSAAPGTPGWSRTQASTAGPCPIGRGAAGTSGSVALGAPRA